MAKVQQGLNASFSWPLPLLFQKDLRQVFLLNFQKLYLKTYTSTLIVRY